MTETTIEDFTRDASEFLDANAEKRSETKFVWGEGSDSVSMLDEKTPEQERQEVEEGKAWKQQEFDAGFGWISGPTEYGGRGLPNAYDRAYRELVGQYAIPSQSPFGIGLGMVAPTILAHAIPEVREKYLRRLWRGEIIGCQLFSEPVAGSDLAGIQTKAERDGDEWIITGQKVWTSGAQYSDIGEIITRTSPDKPKHKGLSMFLVDMHAPGVEVRPLRQMTGGASFNEVFFEEVRVHDSHRLGDVDEGWTVALTTLMNERAAIGGGGAGVGSMSMTRFIEMARHFGLSQEPADPPGPRRGVHLSLGRALHEHAGDREGPRRSAPGAGDVDRQARAHAEHDARGPARRRDPRAAPDCRQRRVGYLRLLRDGARDPGHAGRGRNGRGHAQHRR